MSKESQFIESNVTASGIFLLFPFQSEDFLVDMRIFKYLIGITSVIEN